MNKTSGSSPDQGCLLGFWWEQISAASGSRSQTWLLAAAQDLTMAPGGLADYSHQAVPQYPHDFSSLYTHTILLLLLFLPFLHNSLVHLGGTWGLWVSGVVSRLCLPGPRGTEPLPYLIKYYR